MFHLITSHANYFRYIDDEEYPNDPEERLYFVRVKVGWRRKDDQVEVSGMKGAMKMDPKGISLMSTTKFGISCGHMPGGSTQHGKALMDNVDKLMGAPAQQKGEQPGGSERGTPKQKTTKRDPDVR